MDQVSTKQGDWLGAGHGVEFTSGLHHSGKLSGKISTSLLMMTINVSFDENKLLARSIQPAVGALALKFLSQQ